MVIGASRTGGVKFNEVLGDIDACGGHGRPCMHDENPKPLSAGLGG